jgi:predicted metalloprotease with PDZ domain
MTALPDPGFLASRSFDSPMIVQDVSPGGEAERAGLQVGDTIIQLQGKPAGQESREDASRLNPGDTITVKVRRHGGERELKWKVIGRQDMTYEVKDLDQITPEQRARRTAWLKGEAQTTESANAQPVSSQAISGATK